MYHRVLTNSEAERSFSNSGIVVSDDSFKTHIQYLKNNFNLLNLDDVVDHVESRTQFDNLSCLITFDDGWKDNFNNALPILKAYNAPALVFLPTYYISSNNLFWQECLSNIICSLCRNRKNIPDILTKHGLDGLVIKSPEEIKAGINNYLSSLKSLSNKKIDAILDEFQMYFEERNLSIPTNTVDKYITWEQASEMAENNVQFGSHAISHRLLTKLENSDLNNELKQSKEIINEKLNISISSIAYPNGNFSDPVLASVKRNGYKIGFTTIDGYFDVEENPYKIKRINMHQNATENIPLFLCRILGIF